TISSINTPLSKTYTLTANAETINISTINTAWCSQIKEHGGDIFFPPQYLPTVQKGKLNIIFFHHPLAWFEPNNQKEIRNSLRTDYSIILTGHEHLSDNFKVIGETSNCLMIEAMPFDDATIETNGFTTFEIFDSDILIKNYHWNGSSFEEAKEIRKSDVMKGNSISTSIYSVQYDFYKSLLDIGVNFIHPDKDIIDLNDVFVYPNLKNLSTEDKLEIKKTSSETLF
ncbi:TPA: metallophosphoesterase, partial [Escherichia coli]|nr:metallophosphoesterase [Escherichia coli]